MKKRTNELLSIILFEITHHTQRFGIYVNKKSHFCRRSILHLKNAQIFKEIMDGSSFFASFKAASSSSKEVFQFSGAIDSFPIKGSEV